VIPSGMVEVVHIRVAMGQGHGWEEAGAGRRRGGRRLLACDELECLRRAQVPE
jgi:hypothetical protein